MCWELYKCHLQFNLHLLVIQQGRIDRRETKQNKILGDGYCGGMGEESWLADEGFLGSGGPLPRLCFSPIFAYLHESPLHAASFLLICCSVCFITLPKFLNGRDHTSSLHPSVQTDTWCEVVLQCLLMEAFRGNYAKNSNSNSKDSSHFGGCEESFCAALTRGLRHSAWLRNRGPKRIAPKRKGMIQELLQ